ncbi:IclR family transcriptional regulator domain-containing protein [Salsipaludibacter albus]|uniref:IclR family transcriptional regulator domain-containing protein n=1 Tax=Salsipaludibacter albus TaxID=2849650 RepID=UPI0023688BA4|nr:IclR family transcriptional regulator C-terminal domain-containing protein [Salsipaludibacter albus]MBY5164252.1 helix-turn-helix domain-containing protein [Salsipaludibacter albus]
MLADRRQQRGEGGPVESVQSFARGLAVIRSFGQQAPRQSVSEVATATGLSRATARRLLHTLEGEGLARRSGNDFELTARVLDLGFAFLSSLSVAQLAQPFLDELSATTGESTSVAVLDDTEVVYVARVQANRLMTVAIGLGTRFSAYQTSLGRAQLAWLPDDRVARVWSDSDRRRTTPRTIDTLDDLRASLAEVRERGWALVDQELELGVRSVAAPIRDGSDDVVAAVNVSTHAARTSREDVDEQIVPPLLRAAEGISQAMAMTGRTGRQPSGVGAAS